MCTSKCGGSCFSLLKDNLINSKQSLVELNELLNNLSVCGVPAGTDTTNFMAEINKLKREARSLLDEVDRQAKATDESTINSSGNIEKIFEELSFKERVGELQQKIHGLSHQESVIK